MKEIKFRAWDKTLKQMLIWLELRVDKYFFPSYFNEQEYSIKSRYELMQFTGLKDKNGKEIYEGDIFDCIYKRDGCNHKLVVMWNEENASFRVKGYGKCNQPNVNQSLFDIQRQEVIGNKFEDSKLLK